MLVVLLMGFSSGLPLLLIGRTLKALLTENHLDLATIGFFSLVGLPYTLKVLWSPLMDRFTPLKLGRRRGWLVITQIGLALAFFCLPLINVQTDMPLMATLAFVIAFLSASQDIVVDAYRRDILTDQELGLGSSLYVSGYRFALFVSNAGALLIADKISWTASYWAMAIIMGAGLFATFMAPEPKTEDPPPKTLKEAVVSPLLEFFKRDGAIMILAFILLYKIGESMASDMLNPFYLMIGFTKTEIAAASATPGFIATVLGSMIGGVIMLTLNIYRSLWVFGILQTLGILFFAALATVGHNIPMLVTAVVIEMFTSGMATIAYMAFMASQTKRRFSATQYALLSSLMGVPRIFFGATTGVLANWLGWKMFFVACTIFTLPGLLMLPSIKALIANDE